jgi:prepilin-type N-terminal cleavage/methylation domain-containing protein
MREKKDFTPPLLRSSVRLRQEGAGFTLIELLISLSIFSAIILSLYSVFNTGLFSYRRIKESLSVHQTARKTFNRISLDLKNCFAFSDEEARFQGMKNEMSFLSLVGGSFSSVSYRLEQGKLLRLCKKNSESLKQDSSAQSRIIAKQIRELNFSYAFLTGDEDVYDWKDNWAEAEEEKDKIPLAVKIKLTLEEKLSRSVRDVEFEKIVFLPLAQ